MENVDKVLRGKEECNMGLKDWEEERENLTDQVEKQNKVKDRVKELKCVCLLSSLPFNSIVVHLMFSGLLESCCWY